MESSSIMIVILETLKTLWNLHIGTWMQYCIKMFTMMCVASLLPGLNLLNGCDGALFAEPPLPRLRGTCSFGGAHGGWILETLLVTAASCCLIGLLSCIHMEFFDIRKDPFYQIIMRYHDISLYIVLIFSVQYCTIMLFPQGFVGSVCSRF